MEENTNIEKTTRRKNSPPLKMYATLIMKVVLLIYGAWVMLVVFDYGLCRWKRGWGANECEIQRTEIRSVFTTITVGLIGWISDSPMEK